MRRAGKRRGSEAGVKEGEEATGRALGEGSGRWEAGQWAMGWGEAAGRGSEWLGGEVRETGGGKGAWREQGTGAQ